MTVAPTGAPDVEALPNEKQLQYNIEENLTPLRFHATRVPERLSSSGSTIINQSLLRKNLSSDTTKPSSRSVSPSLRAETDANSSISSLDTESDILTDRMGLEELDLEKQKYFVCSFSSLPPVNERLSKDTLEDVHAFSDIIKTTGSLSSSSLPPLNERLSKDTLEDVHAFSDIIKTSGSVSSSSLPPVNERLSKDTLEDVNAFSNFVKTSGSVSSREQSRANSIATGGDVGSLLLETLDEGDELDEDVEEGVVHISNLDEIHGEASSDFTTEDLQPLRLSMTHLKAWRVLDSKGAAPYSFSSAPLSPLPDSKTHTRRRSNPDMICNNSNHKKTSSTASDVLNDILTDRMGLEELDLEKSTSHIVTSAPNLPPVTERLSEGTLEDIHAFTDVKSAASTVSRANSVAGEVSHLETLDEGIEENEEQDLQIISNIENITIDDRSEKTSEK
eukprot:CAMPEP_0194208182 /NCGR_PEP_ID=MMETSP0156-20130528/6697_1 /TAXON_ID=33649 /ORGANISM="Thalassionema nitzschioides, Strain L26-B" /LENGTH=447 /DNA_ID=CAMNT_0038935091 /DNA_START=113 /DNA_END=1456 /DNA_ORIENTATION=+